MRQQIMRAVVLGLIAVFVAELRVGVAAAQNDQLPSWNDGPAKQSIVEFVAKVTKEGTPEFVPVPERIAVFDNDGTLWSEQPMYVQLAFVLDRVKALAPTHPEWKAEQPFKAALEDDIKTLAAGGEHALVELVLATHAGMTTDEFAEIVKEWLATAKNPMVYQPMIELLAYMRANGFKTYIVSGGGVEFMRVFSEQVYGVPPEQVIGSTGKTKFGVQDGKPVILRLQQITFIDDKDGKPLGDQSVHWPPAYRRLWQFGRRFPDA